MIKSPAIRETERQSNRKREREALSAFVADIKLNFTYIE